MKKKSLFAIMLIALVLTLGLVVSCQPDPDPDELEGTWVYTIGSSEFKLVIDGFGSYKSTTKVGGSLIGEESGTYTFGDGYITSQVSMDSQYTQDDPEYVFVKYDSVGDEYWILTADDAGPHAYPGSGEYEYNGPFELTGGNTYTMDESETLAGITFREREVYTVNPSSLSFAGTISWKNGDTLLYKMDVSGSATCVTDGGAAPAPYLHFYNDTYSKCEKTTKFVHNGNTLKVYMNAEEITLTKQ